MQKLRRIFEPKKNKEEIRKKVERAISLFGDLNKKYSRILAIENEALNLEGKEREEFINLLLKELRKARERRRIAYEKSRTKKVSPERKILLEYETAGDVEYHIIRILEKIGDRKVLEELSRTSLAEFESGDVRRAARRAMRKIIINELSPPRSARNWYNNIIKPFEKAAIAALTDDIYDLSGDVWSALKLIEVLKQKGY